MDDLLSYLPPTHILLRTLYLTLTLVSLILTALPGLSRHLIAYGKALAPPPPTRNTTPGQTPSLLARLPHILHNLTVPHGWFTHFYMVAVVSNLIWGWQIATHGGLYRALRVEGMEDGGKRKGGMGIEQVVVVWGCLMVQTGRRLWECLYVMKPGKSRMSVLHYIIGWAFYVGVSVAVWIEGCGAIDRFNFSYTSLRRIMGPPSLKTFIGIFVWAFASGVQHDAHAHLASLRKYSLPTHPVFNSLVSPHYTAEVGVYLGMAVLAAPRGSVLNWTLGCVVVFIVTVLGESARETRRWYGEKFGSRCMEDKWVIIPWVY